MSVLENLLFVNEIQQLDSTNVQTFSVFWGSQKGKNLSYFVFMVISVYVQNVSGST